MFVRLIFFLSLVACVCTSRAAEHSVAELLERVRSNQDVVKSGDWKVKTRHQILGSNPPRSYDATFHIEFEGDKIRVQREVGDRTTVYCSPYMSNTQSFFFTSHPKSVMPTQNVPDHVRLPDPICETLILYERKNFDKLYSVIGISEDTTIPYVKTMGFVTDDIFFQKRHFVTLSPYLKKFEEREYSGTMIVQEEFGGGQCVVIRRAVATNGPVKFVTIPIETGESDKFWTLSKEGLDELQKTARVYHIDESRLDEIWLDPTKNYTIRRMVRKDSLIGTHMILENDLKLDEPSGVWYPVAWTFEEYRNDQLRVREENTLEVISINQPIDPKRFTLESLGYLLKPGTPVEWKLDIPPPGKGKLEWDGEKIFAHGEFGEHWVMRDVDPNRKKRIIIVLCINVAVISAYLAARYYLRWRNQ